MLNLKLCAFQKVVSVLRGSPASIRAIAAHKVVPHQPATTADNQHWTASLRFSFICIIFLIVTSCNNSEVKIDNKTPDQEQQLRDMILQYPDSILLKETLVQYFRDNDNYRQAITETEAALKKDSLNARLLNIKATLHFEDGDTINAIKAFEKAISINPRPEYIISLGSVYAQNKNPKALEMADALLQEPTASFQGKALFIKGLYFSFTGKKIKAITFFNACIKLDYRDLLAYREKAICMYDLNKYATSLDILKQAITVQNTFDEGYYWMGRCYEKLDKRDEAIHSYKLALQFDPDYKEAKDALARLGIE